MKPMVVRRIALPAMTVTILVMLGGACSHRSDAQNSLSQHTGEAGSTMPKSHGPYYPNTAGNIVAPPGNPAGNPSGSPPLVGGTENQQPAWPQGR
ncbi:MAG TPA: hypothetical protein VJL88_01685 [Nitrospira sp.]|nr:hypothetical protein [Nitrospira sp.]